MTVLSRLAFRTFSICSRLAKNSASLSFGGWRGHLSHRTCWHPGHSFLAVKVVLHRWQVRRTRIRMGLSTRRTVSSGATVNKSEASITSPNFSPIFLARSSKIFNFDTTATAGDPWIASDLVSSRRDDGLCVLDATASRLSDLNALFTLEMTLPTPLSSASCPGTGAMPVAAWLMPARGRRCCVLGGQRILRHRVSRSRLAICVGKCSVS